MTSTISKTTLVVNSIGGLATVIAWANTLAPAIWSNPSLKGFGWGELVLAGFVVLVVALPLITFYRTAMGFSQGGLRSKTLIYLNVAVLVVGFMHGLDTFGKIGNHTTNPLEVTALLQASIALINLLILVFSKENR